MAKTIAVAIQGSGGKDNLRECTIDVGTTAGDLKRALGLDNYLISRPGSATQFADEENVYEAVSDGDKLLATPTAVVGSALSDFLKAFVSGGSQATPAPCSSSKVEVRAPENSQGSGIRVRPDTRPHWQQRGWQKKNNRLYGAYRTRWGSFYGRIDLGARPVFWILDAPPAVLRSSRGPCFRFRKKTESGKKWYVVHWAFDGRDPDAGIVSIEGLLTKCFLEDRKRNARREGVTHVG